MRGNSRLAKHPKIALQHHTNVCSREVLQTLGPILGRSSFSLAENYDGKGRQLPGRSPRRGLQEPIIVSQDPIELGSLEVWIADQPDPKPSREEAARRLIAPALASK
jgi:hypothetical protein